MGSDIFFMGKFKVLYGTVPFKNDEMVIFSYPAYDVGVVELLQLDTFKRKHLILYIDKESTGKFTKKCGYTIYYETPFHKVVGDNRVMIKEERVRSLLSKFPYYNPNDDPMVDAHSVRSYTDTEILTSYTPYPLWHKDIVGKSAHFKNIEVTYSREGTDTLPIEADEKQHIKNVLVDKLSRELLKRFDEVVTHSTEVTEKGTLHTGKINIL